jgi:spore germination protein GerM
MVHRRQKKIPPGLIAAALILLAAIAAIVYYLSAPRQEQRATIKIYLTKGDRLVEVERPLVAKAPPLNSAMDALLSGPTEAEKAAGITTLIPTGARVLHQRVRDGVAIIDFNPKLENYGGGSARVEAMIAQIVYTATAVPGVEKAWIWVEGKKEIVLGGEGLVLDKPLGRSDLGR